MPITEQELVNVGLDAETFKAIVNGGPTEVVTARLGRVFKTLAKTLADMEGAVIPAAVSDNTLAIRNMQNTLFINQIHVDAVNGDDLNDGLSQATSVKTASRVYALLKSGLANWINMYSNLEWDHLSTLRHNTNIYFIGNGYVLTFVDAINSATSLGTFKATQAFCCFRFLCGVVIGGTRSGNALEITTGFLGVWHQGHSIEKLNTAHDDSKLYFNQLGGSVNTYLHGSTLVNMAGSFAVGVTAGANPNNRLGFESNLTSG